MKFLSVIVLLALVSYSQCAKAGDCNGTQYFESYLEACINKQAFGGRCNSNMQCDKGLTCTYTGSLQGTCKLDLNGTCSSGKDCANQLSCIAGKCKCHNKYASYDSKMHDCFVNKMKGEGEACKENSQCGTFLACDSMSKVNATNTCQRDIDEYCIYSSQCANELVCSDHWCDCPEGHYYDEVTKNCFHKRQFNEACLKNQDCAKPLACDVRVQPTPLSYNRHFTCLKTFGVECNAGLECVNYLPCNNGYCGCRPNYYYNELLVDCLPQQSFGKPCHMNSECLPNLGCDVSTSSSQSHVCLYLEGATCSRNEECVNNLDCVSGKCACPSSEAFDSMTKKCVFVRP